MGKKGDLLRQQKRQRVIRTFTEEELIEHDRAVIRAHLERSEGYAKELDRQRDEAFKVKADAVWKEREERFASMNPEDNTMETLSFLLAVSCRVLIEQFGWKPPGPRGRNPKIMKYAVALQEEIRKICWNKLLGMQEYSRETEKLYGINFEYREDK